MTRKLEVCSFNLTDFNKIIKHKVSRVELCVKKEVGGITPPYSDIEYATSKNITCNLIIKTNLLIDNSCQYIVGVLKEENGKNTISLNIDPEC